MTFAFLRVQLEAIMTVQHAIRWTTVLAAAVLSSGCDLFQSDPDLQVSVSVNAASFAVGDVAEVLVVVTNTSGNERTVTGGGCLFGFQVFDAAGSFVAPHGICPAARFEEQISPGESVERRWNWSGFTGLEDPHWLLPGTYSVVGVLDADEAVIQSPAVSVELLPPI